MTESANGSQTKLYGLDEESRSMVLNMVGQLRERLLTREKILEYDQHEIFTEENIRKMLDAGESLASQGLRILDPSRETALS